jgi:uncharacterized protein YjbI with pentapeptide repeats
VIRVPVSFIAGLGLAGVLVVAMPVPGRAACTDRAAPRVDWRRCYHDDQDLRRADLTGAGLWDASFQRSDLGGAVLVRVDGYGARFIAARLQGAVLDDARLIEADFTQADLAGASLRRADLREAVLADAGLRGADLTGARIDGAHFLNADLSGALWTDGRRCAEGSRGHCD